MVAFRLFVRIGARIVADFSAEGGRKRQSLPGFRSAA